MKKLYILLILATGISQSFTHMFRGIFGDRNTNKQKYSEKYKSEYKQKNSNNWNSRGGAPPSMHHNHGMHSHSHGHGHHSHGHSFPGHGSMSTTQFPSALQPSVSVSGPSMGFEGSQQDFIDGGSYGASAVTISSSDMIDGIAAANVIGTYYNTLVQKKGAIHGITPVSGILAYPTSNGIYTDYWGKIQFTMGDGGVLVDSSGYFTGVPVKTKEDIISTGYLSDIGFYQKKGLSKQEMDKNYINAKMLIEEIAAAT